MSTLEMLFQGAVARDRVKAESQAQILLFLLAMVSLGCLVVAAFLYHPIAGFSAAGVAGLVMEARLSRKPGR